MNGDGGQQMSAAKLSEYSGAPSKRTLLYWKSNAENPVEVTAPQNPPGRPSKLTPDQLKIIGGFILFCVESHQGCTVMDIQNFAQTAFHERLSEPFISQHVHELGFSSHRPASLKFTYGGIDTAKAAVDFLRTNQSKLSKFKNTSRVVALDQISFWDCGVTTSSYSLIGG
jgi:hypothetical protein